MAFGGFPTGSMTPKETHMVAGMSVFRGFICRVSDCEGKRERGHSIQNVIRVTFHFCWNSPWNPFFLKCIADFNMKWWRCCKNFVVAVLKMKCQNVYRTVASVTDKIWIFSSWTISRWHFWHLLQQFLQHTALDIFDSCIIHSLVVSSYKLNIILKKYCKPDFLTTAPLNSSCIIKVGGKKSESGIGQYLRHQYRICIFLVN